MRDRFVMDDFNLPPLLHLPPADLRALRRQAEQSITCYGDLLATLRDEIDRLAPGLPLPPHPHRAPAGMLVHHAFPRFLARAQALSRHDLLPPLIRWLAIGDRSPRNA